IFLDPWGARGMVPALSAAGLRVVEQPMTARHQDGLIRRVEELAYAGRLIHSPDPVLDYAVSQVRVEASQTGRRLVKPTEHVPIDPAVALVMAVGHVDTELPWEQLAEPQIVWI
ncbi:MAG: hypothetical protein NZ899_15315, partial [Thermoguttaceae bacterium]|nr:hypothetical protein [Thermoguttaceae bacterium]